MQSTQPDNAAPIRIVVVIEGGLVQDVISNMPVTVTVIDYDVEGHDPVSDQTYAIPQDKGSVEPAYRSTYGASIDTGRVDQIENAPLYFDYDQPVDKLVKRWLHYRVKWPWPEPEQRVQWSASFELDGCPFEFSLPIPVTSIETAQALATRCLNEIWPDQVEKLDQSFLPGVPTSL